MKSKFKKLIRYGFLIAYIGAIIVLLIESMTPGAQSADQSNKVGNTIGDILDKITGENNEMVNPTDIVIENIAKTHYVGETFQLNATVKPSNATYQSIAWKSSNDSIATIDAKGQVRCLRKGTVEFTAVSTKDNKIKRTIGLDIKNVDATNVEIVSASDIIYVSKSLTLKAIVTPLHATEQVIDWQSMDATIATVDEDGIVTGKAPGTVTIIATLLNNIQASLTLEVKPLPIVHVDEVRITKQINQLYINDRFTFVAVALPNDAVYRKVYWELKDDNDEYIGTINKDGAFYAKQPGLITLVAYSEEDKKIYQEITVTVVERPLPNYFEVIVPHDSLIAGTTMKVLLNHITPTTASYQDIHWSSSNEQIAVVDQQGMIKGLQAGIVTITVASALYETSFDMEITEQTIIPVESIVTDLPLEQVLYVGQAFSLLVAVYPYHATDPSLRFQSSDSSILYVDDRGRVQAQKAGQCKITISSNADTSITLVFDCTVINVPVDHIFMELPIPGYMTMNLGDKTNLNVVVSSNVLGMLPTNPTLIWEVSDQRIAQVGDGQIVATMPGTTEVTVYAATNPSVRLAFTLEVLTIKADYISIEAANGSLPDALYVGSTLQLNAVITPNNASNLAVTWKSTHPQVLAINQDGTMTALKQGSAVITAISKSDSAVMISVTMKVQNVISTCIVLDSVMIEQNSATLIAGSSAKLNAILDSKATYTVLNYHSSNEAVATIGTDGIVTAIKSGKTTITVTCDDGDSDPISAAIELEVIRQSYIKDWASFRRLVRKGIGHFGSFLVLGILASGTYLFFMKKKYWAFALSLVSGLIVAGATEFAQVFTPGRSGLLTDVWIDYSGYLFSTLPIFIVVVILALRVYFKTHHSKKIPCETVTQQETAQRLIRKKRNIIK